MIDRFKLKHLNDIANEDINYKELMAELIGYRDNWYNRLYHFIKSYKKIQTLVTIISGLRLANIKLNPKCEIKLPEHIDFITFSAMMKVQMLITNPGERNTPELICELISLVCFSANSKSDFDTDSLPYIGFKNRVWNSSLIDTVGLYNHINRELVTSTKKWQELFMSVEVTDKDYDEAGGQRMNQFNVITTIERLCQAFNYTEEQAWQVSYALSQTHSYKNATYSHIQNEMTLIKERKMKLKRNVK